MGVAERTFLMQSSVPIKFKVPASNHEDKYSLSDKWFPEYLNTGKPFFFFPLTSFLEMAELF